MSREPGGYVLIAEERAPLALVTRTFLLSHDLRRMIGPRYCGNSRRFTPFGTWRGEPETARRILDAAERLWHGRAPIDERGAARPETATAAACDW